MKWLTPEEFRDHFGLRRSTYFLLMKQGHIPKPIHIGPRTVRHDIEEAERIFRERGGFVADTHSKAKA